MYSCLGGKKSLRKNSGRALSLHMVVEAKAPGALGNCNIDAHLSQRFSEEARGNSGGAHHCAFGRDAKAHGLSKGGK